MKPLERTPIPAHYELAFYFGVLHVKAQNNSPGARNSDGCESR